MFVLLLSLFHVIKKNLTLVVILVNLFKRCYLTRVNNIAKG